MDKNNEEESLYTTTSDGVKFGTYHNQKFESEITEEVDLPMLISDIDSLIKIIDSFLAEYKSLLIFNYNEFNVCSGENNKKTVSFYLIAKFVQNLVISIKEAFSNDIIIHDNPGIINKVNKTIDDVIEQEITSAGLTELFSNQYKDGKNQIIEVLTPLFNHEKQIRSCNKKGGIVLCDVSIKYTSHFFNLIMGHIGKFKAIKVFRQSKSDLMMDNWIILFDLLLLLDRLEALDLVLFNSFFYVDENDITNLPESSSEWVKMKKNITRIIPNNSEIIYKAISDISKGMGVMGSIMAHGFKSSSTFKNVFSSGWIVLGYKFNPKKAIYDGKKQDLLGNRAQSALDMCNTMKVGIIKKLTVRRFPKIEFRRKLYLRRDEKEITVDYIKELVQLIKSGKTEVENGNSEDEMLKHREIMGNKRLAVNAPSDSYLEKIQKQHKPYYVSTRLIHSSKITFANEKPSFFSFCGSPRVNVTKDTLIIHIHGGGFIGTSTLTHEGYLRSWVNELQVPLIGIDYSLSPATQYPKAVDDVWQAYNWIIKHVESEFNISTKRIILSGDSAGGNLIFALVFLLIVHKRRLPDLILAEYPCCDTSLYNMSPSMLLCLGDGILNINFLKFCNEAYRRDYEDDEDPFLNPIKATPGLIKKMPLTYFFLGSCDPLRDGAIRLMYKMSQQDVPFKTYEFKEYIHGFYGIDNAILRRTPTYILLKEVKDFIQREEEKTKKKGTKIESIDDIIGAK